MKKFSKILSVALLVALVLSLGVANAFADASKITIDRDSTWDSTAESKNTTYTYYKIFDAVITTPGGVDHDTGENKTPEGNVVYTVDSKAKADALPDIFKADLASDGKYYVTLVNNSTGAADIVAALKTMVETNTTLFPGTPVTSDANPVVLNVGSDGYYLILASNGKDAAVQTIGNVTIKEKNDYPTIDKKQKKEADSTYSEAVLPIEIGSYIDYQVTVHISGDANKQIAVIDKMTPGLEYDSTTGLTVTPTVAYSTLTSTDNGYDATITENPKSGWQIKFAYDDYKTLVGTDVVITFRAKVTEAALQDTGKENEVTLNYDNGNYILKDHVNYETYFTGIEKVDGSTKTGEGDNVTYTKKLKDVKFVLKVGDTAVNVTKTDAGYYIPGGSSNEVVTDADGKIIIRGLDNTKTYTLTETETNAGYNLLSGPKTLRLEKDVKTGEGNEAVDVYTTEKFDVVENNSGTQLPSTGGIGTTIFYVVGGVLVLAAIILLVTKKRMSE